jgi:glutamate racemase
MSKEGIKALVVACNTATSIAINDLRKIYSFPIFGMEPAVKPAIEKNCSKRIWLLPLPLNPSGRKISESRNQVGACASCGWSRFAGTGRLVEYAER